jgi:ribonuclease P protein component
VQDSPSSTPFEFKVAYRLSRADGFGHVVRADHVADNHLKVYFIGNLKNHARIGMITGKKSLPRSVDRNHAKRLIRETFRQNSIKLCKLDLVVKVSGDYSRQVDLRIDKLKKLFSQIESRCAK